jgi:hypothetical protein
LTANGREGTDSLARIVFALLIVCCFAAFFITQRLKHTPTLLQEFRFAGHFSPHAPAGHNLEAISFKPANAERITVTIVDADEHTVATLFVGHAVARYKRFSLRWNGREGTADGYTTLTSPDGRALLVPNTDGSIAPAGEYHVDVTLLGQGGRVIPSTGDFTLQNAPAR